MNEENPTVKYGITIISDVLSCFGLPTATAMEIYKDLLQKRASEGFEILLSEIRQGNFKSVNQHEIVSIIARFQRDVMEGVARNNLRLMARIINGMAEKNEISAPSFLRYANVLASLTDEEIKALGIMTKHALNPPHKGMFHRNPNKKQTEPDDPEKDELKAALPNYAVIQQALVRTGLVYFTVNSHSSDDFNLDTGDFSGSSGSLQMGINSKLDYRLTHLMFEILKYTDFFPTADAS